MVLFRLHRRQYFVPAGTNTWACGAGRISICGSALHIVPVAFVCNIEELRKHADNALTHWHFGRLDRHR
jgi:hypothetical protein